MDEESYTNPYGLVIVVGDDGMKAFPTGECRTGWMVVPATILALLVVLTIGVLAG
jgi:hypothetical protein